MGMVFKRVPLKVLLDSLLALYNAGADFVDVLDEPSIASDAHTTESVNNIGFVVRTEYLNKDVENEQEFLDNMKEEKFYLKQMEQMEEEEDEIYRDVREEQSEGLEDLDDIINGSI